MQGLGWLTTEELQWARTEPFLQMASELQNSYRSRRPEILNVRFFKRENSVPTVNRSKAVRATANARYIGLVHCEMRARALRITS